MTGAVRTNLPSPLAHLAGGIVEQWGVMTSRWRMIPHFIIVGAQRSGTTTLYRVLSDHPSLVRPTMSKGIGYFDLNYARGIRWYRGHFPLRALARLKTRGRPVYTFESSGYYLFHPLVASRIAADLPDTRLVVLVRDPVERAYSAHRHEFARGFENESFETAISLEETRTRGESERLVADPTYQSFEHRHHSYLARSQYSEQIAVLIDAVGRERVHIMDADRFFEGPIEELKLLSSWLGIPAWLPERVEQWNAQKREPMDPELRSELMEHFRIYDEALSEQMGRTPAWREH